MDSRYHEFVWLTVKEHCMNCAIGSSFFALIFLYFLMQSIVFLGSFTLCMLFAWVFVMGNRTAHYVATMIQIEREETESSEAVTS